MSEKAPRFAARVETRDGVKRGALYLYDMIGGWGGIDPNTVVAKLDALKAAGATALDVYINSPGGDVFDGMAIHAEISRWDRGERVVSVDGLAASIASVIAMAGDRIRVAPGGMMMVHNPRVLARGEARDLRKIADQLDAIRSVIIGIYAGVTKKESAEIEKLMDAETWMTAAQSVELGFAHELVSSSAPRAEFPAALLEPVALSPMFANSLPETAIAVWRQRQPQIGGHAEEDTMNEEQRKALAEQLGLPADASGEDITKAASGLSVRMGVCAAVLAELGLQPDASQEAAVGAVLKLKNPADRVTAERVQTLEQQLRARDVAEVLAEAQREEKLTGKDTEQYGWAERYANADIEGFRIWKKSAPRVVPLTPIQAAGGDKRAASQSLDELERKYCGQLGLTDEDLKEMHINV